MRANLAIEDIILIVLYFASVLFIGFRARKKIMTQLKSISLLAEA